MRCLAASDGELTGDFPPFTHLPKPHMPAHDKEHKKPYSREKPR